MPVSKSFSQRDGEPVKPNTTSMLLQIEMNKYTCPNYITTKIACLKFGIAFCKLRAVCKIIMALILCSIKIEVTSKIILKQALIGVIGHFTH